MHTQCTHNAHKKGLDNTFHLIYNNVMFIIMSGGFNMVLEKGTCFCGGKLIGFHAPIEKCEDCERFYLEGILMIPWKGWKTSNEGILCRRCNGSTEYDVETYRVKCNDKNCALEWRSSPNMKNPNQFSPVESDLTRDIKVAKQLMFEDEAAGEDDKILYWAKKIKALNDKKVLLKQEVL